ncbi:MAG: DNA/RNA non-specific endonuclease [Prevotella sp.]
MNKTLLIITLAIASITKACDDKLTKSAEQLRVESQKTIDFQPQEHHQKPTATTAMAIDSFATVPAKATSAQFLHREAYTVCYNAETRLPHWVAWRLTADHTTGPHKRGGIKFQEDEQVPAPRATDADYRSSGYDRGHMCPSGDNKWSEVAQRESFLMTNICPQVHNLNAGDWNEMEQQCRRWAEQYGEIYIVCGPILYRQKHKTIGKNKVVVPEAFFKVVLCLGNDPKAVGFIYKNAEGNRPKGDYVNSVDQVERLTGIDFFPTLPDSIENRIEAEATLLPDN